MKSATSAMLFATVTLVLFSAGPTRASVIGQWDYETSAGAPVAVGQSADGQQVDDSAGHAGGPLHGTGYGGTSLQYSADLPATIVGSDGQATTRSLSFDGSNDYVNLGNNSLLLDLPQGPFTVETWVKTSDTNRAVILGSYDGSHRCLNFEIGSPTYGHGAIRAYMNDNSNLIDMWGTQSVIDGQWHHVAMVYSGLGTNNVKLYVDGELDKTGTYGGGLYSIGSSAVLLGTDLRASGRPYLGGLMDGTRISNQALAPTQFLIKGDGEQNYYRMETDGGVAVTTGQGAVVVDDTGLHPFTYNGQALPSPAPPSYSGDVVGRWIQGEGAPGLNEHSLSFSGDGGDYVELGDQPLLTTLTEGDFTIEFFLKTPSRDSRSVVVGTYDGNTSYILNLEIGGATHGANKGHLRPYFRSGGATDEFWGDTDISDDEWHHVALVRSGAGTASDLVQLYVDYRLDGHMALNTGQYTLRPSFFRLGRDSRGSGYYYQGLLDEFRISRGALDVGDFLREVPEPASFTLLISAGIGLLLRRRRRRERIRP